MVTSSLPQAANLEDAVQALADFGACCQLLAAIGVELAAQWSGLTDAKAGRVRPVAPSASSAAFCEERSHENSNLLSGQAIDDNAVATHVCGPTERVIALIASPAWQRASGSQTPYGVPSRPAGTPYPLDRRSWYTGLIPSRSGVCIAIPEEA